MTKEPMSLEVAQGIAWAGFVDWAFNQAEIREAFVAATGRNPWVSRSPIDLAIDRATGRMDDDVKAFVFWATREIWGLDQAPAQVRAEIEAANRAAAGAEGDAGRQGRS